MSEPKRRILHIFRAMARGGAETRTMEIYRNLDKDKFQFDFLVSVLEEQYYDSEIKKLGGRIINVSHKSGFIGGIKRIYDVLKEYGPFYAIHSHVSHYSSIAMIAGKIANVKVRVTHSRTASDSDKDRLGRKIYFKVSTFLINLFSTDLVTCGTEAGCYLFGKRAMKSGKVKFLPNATDLSKFANITKSKQTIRENFGFPLDTTIVGHVGNLNKVKNHNFLLDIFNEYLKENKNALLVLVGEGNERNNIENKIKKLEITDKVMMLGSRDDVPMLLHTFDLFVFPSFYEGVPGVIVEAQATGLPCILSDTITKDVDVGTNNLKYLSINENAKIWAEEIKKLLNSKITNKASCIKLLKKAGYDVKDSTRKLEKIYG